MIKKLGVFLALLFSISCSQSLKTSGILGGSGDQSSSSTGTPSGPIAINSVQGSLTHKNIITIVGSSFGIKSTAAPVVWDDASGTSLSQNWDYATPNSNDAAFQINYRTPAQVTLQNGPGGLALPHSHDTKYLAGAAYSSTTVGSDSGFATGAGKNNQQGNPYTYITYYRAIDPHWTTNNYIATSTFCSESPTDPGCVYCAQNPSSPKCICTGSSASPNSLCDHNLKEYSYSTGTGDYGSGGPYYYAGHDSDESPLGSSNWAINYAAQSTINNVVYSFLTAIYSVNTLVMNYYPSAGTMYSNVSVPGPGQGWQRAELIFKHASADGFNKIFQDNQLVWDVSLNDDALGLSNSTDGMNLRNEMVVGGYQREYGSTPLYMNNWRYYSDIYYDHTLARVMLANNATYSSATILEPQVPTSWSAGQISVTVNLGKFTAGQTAYLYVFDSNNNHNATGYPVTITGP